MTKQEEIREGIAREIFIWHIGKPWMWEQKTHWEGPLREEYYKVADIIIKKEISQDVVIKDRCFGMGIDTRGGYNWKDTFFVIPLIGG